ncbi:HIRA-interacting protein 5, partial [Ascodesmis nigricans]
RTLFIQTAPTPNPSAVKFIPGTPILPPSTPTIEYLSGRLSHSSPLARKLFSIDGVSSILFSPDFITINKTATADWSNIKPEVFALLTEALSSGETVIDLAAAMKEKSGEFGVEGSYVAPDTAPQDGDSEVVEMVKELLDTRIRPTIQEDGGDIEYLGFDEGKGIVRVRLRGACRSCDSSATTMRNGIESMLMHYIDEVNAVEQIMDEDETDARAKEEADRARFEEKLRKVKGVAK